MRRLPTLAALSLLALCPPGGRGAEGQATGDERLLREAGVKTDGPGLLAFFRRQTASEEGRLPRAILARHLRGLS
jgi:hypothetical protein